MTAIPPGRGSDPLGELAEWLAEGLPKATRQVGEGLARIGSQANKVAEILSARLNKFKER